jgi:hypothetical protein
MNEREKEYTLKTIDFYTEILKMLSFSILATITGLISLIFNWNEFTGRMFILSFFGWVIMLIQVGMFSCFYREMRSLTKKKLKQ